MSFASFKHSYARLAIKNMFGMSHWLTEKRGAQCINPGGRSKLICLLTVTKFPPPSTFCDHAWHAESNLRGSIHMGKRCEECRIIYLKLLKSPLRASLRSIRRNEMMPKRAAAARQGEFCQGRETNCCQFDTSKAGILDEEVRNRYALPNGGSSISMKHLSTLLIYKRKKK